MSAPQPKRRRIATEEDSDDNDDDDQHLDSPMVGVDEGVRDENEEIEVGGVGGLMACQNNTNETVLT